jgi:hypothetical protein
MLVILLRDDSWIKKGHKGLVQTPLNSRLIFSLRNGAEVIVTKEQKFGGLNNIEEVTTHAFLSHKRSSAQGVAGRIFQELKTEYKIFLDSEASFNLHNLQLIVKYTGLFIFILSEGIFDSYWCLEELRSAIRNKRRIVVVRMFQFEIPDEFPPEMKDIEDFIKTADKIVYMAEFFGEFIRKLKTFFGPSKLLL